MSHDPDTASDTGPPTGPPTGAYRDALIMALRLNDVPGDRIGEIVAEVESHVADTGEDPVEAFGPAQQYAASLDHEHRPEPWWHTALTVACAAVSGWFVAQGALALLLGQTYLGAPGWVWVLVAVVVAGPAAVRVRQRSSLVRDPRSGDSLTPTPWWSPLVLVGLPVAIVLVAYVIIRVQG